MLPETHFFCLHYINHFYISEATVGRDEKLKKDETSHLKNLKITCSLFASLFYNHFLFADEVLSDSSRAFDASFSFVFSLTGVLKIVPFFSFFGSFFFTLFFS